jgi:photosystem II stability/assembly factor-like uncharacterized protein
VAGAAVPAADLGTIGFLGREFGVGVTSSPLRCVYRIKSIVPPGHVVDVGTRAFPAWLAVTINAGETWHLEGTRLPPGVNTSLGQASMAFISADRGWITASGKLLGTTDGSRAWKDVNLGGAVLSLTVAGGRAWSLVSGCPSLQGPGCLVGLWEGTATGWSDMGQLPDRTGYAPPLLSVDSAGQVAVALGSGPAPRSIAQPVLYSADGGRHWSAPADPCQPPAWNGPQDLSMAGPGRIWLLCLGAAAAGSTTTALFTTTDAGQHWMRVAAVTDLGSIPVHGLPTGDAGPLAVETSTKSWDATDNALSVSTDAGHTWSTIRNVRLDGSGSYSSFSFIDPTHGWLLGPGRGLWRTVNGRRWTLLGRSY